MSDDYKQFNPRIEYPYYEVRLLGEAFELSQRLGYPITARIAEGDSAGTWIVFPTGRLEAHEER